MNATKKADLWLILPCAALILGLGLGVIFVPHREFSEAENRALTIWQTPTLRRVLDGTATEQLTEFYTDQFPLRTRLTALKAATERGLGKLENNGILFGTEGYLLARSQYESLDTAVSNLDACERIGAWAQARGIPCTMLLPPRGVDILTEQVPALYRLTDTPTILSLLRERGLEDPQLYTALEQLPSPYYKTDHHWTTEGAYAAYTVLARELGVTPYPPEDFVAEVVTESFRGTSYSTAGCGTTATDSVTLYRYAGDTDILVRNEETGEERHGFYEFDALSEKDCYRVFLGGNFSRLTVTDPSAQKPRLLLIKDSFANALVPFLARHFQLEILDPRYHKGIPSLEGYDHILIVWGVDTLATDPSLARFCRALG